MCSRARSLRSAAVDAGEAVKIKAIKEAEALSYFPPHVLVAGILLALQC